MIFEFFSACDILRSVFNASSWVYKLNFCALNCRIGSDRPCVKIYWFFVTENPFWTSWCEIGLSFLVLRVMSVLARI